jgi:1,4-dihydroxy-2-naphthoate octaprenyltransferase
VLKSWIQAARPAAHGMIFIPLLAGQALAFRIHGVFDWSWFFHLVLYGILYQIYVLYINDYADEELDRDNHTYWLSGGSRVIPQGKLSGQALWFGSWVILGLLLAQALYWGVGLKRPGMSLLMIGAVGLGWAYSLPPLRLSCRGHGEILQGVGCGVLLTLTGFYTQVGSLESFPWMAGVPLFLIFYAGNIITALHDYPADLAGNKRTYPVRLGQRRSRKHILALLFCAYILISWVTPNLTNPVSLFALAQTPSLLILLIVKSKGWLERGDIENTDECQKFVLWTTLSQVWLLLAWITSLFWGIA